MLNTAYVKKIIFHRGIVILLLRFYLGGLFLYASLHKIHDTVQFKNIIANYEILPYWSINITAIVLPWIEFFVGAFLIVGIFVRSCAMMQIMLLAMFIFATGFNISRGLKVYCGCFSKDTVVSGMNYWHIIFNTSLVLMAIMLLLILERRRFSHRFYSALSGIFLKKDSGRA